jgi:hypothetical protein
MSDGNRLRAEPFRPVLGVEVPDIVLQVGSDLAEIEPTRGFRTLMELLQREHDSAGQRFIRDETTSKKYARGYLAGLAYLLEHIPELIRVAREIKESREETGEFLDSRIGGGSGSLA